MEWRETWHKISPWHFAFEKQCVDNRDYIFIQDAEHQDNIHENFNKNKNIIIENKKSNTMKQVVILTESDLHRVIKESVNSILSELDWKTYANASQKRKEQGDLQKAHNLKLYAGKQFQNKHDLPNLEKTI